MQIAKYIFSCLLFLLPCVAPCQEFDEEYENHLAERITQFIDEFDQLANDANLRIRITDANLESDSYTRILNTRIATLNNHLQSLDFRWNAFTQAEQADLAASEHLMDLMTQAQQLRQLVTDTIAAQKNKCNALVDFIEAERLIRSQDTVYQNLYKKALSFSLSKQQAPKLEKVKAKEQALFEKLQTSYNKSKDAVQLMPQLAKRGDRIGEQFYALKSFSTKIQAIEYKPFIQRAKDYLMGLACVAVILIFINMVNTKLKASKKAREMLKKQAEMLKKSNNEDYPTI